MKLIFQCTNVGTNLHKCKPHSLQNIDVSLTDQNQFLSTMFLLCARESERARECTCGCFYASALLLHLGLQHHNTVRTKLQIKSATNVVYVVMYVMKLSVELVFGGM